MRESKIDATQELDESLYSMRVVARMTGLAPDTIRVWERRYQAVHPARTTGNARRYSTEAVQRLQLLQRATALGYAIGAVARLETHELDALVRGDASGPQLPTSAASGALAPTFMALREQYLRAVEEFAVQRAARILQRAAALLERDDFLFNIVQPILGEVGCRWESRRLGVAHEHLVSAQVRGLLQSELRFVNIAPGAPKIVVATAPHQAHEFGALIGAFLAASRGFEPIYLGADLPWEQIVLASERSAARLVLLGFLRDLAADELAECARGTAQVSASGAQLWMGLPRGHALVAAVPGPRYFHTFAALDVALVDRGARASL